MTLVAMNEWFFHYQPTRELVTVLCVPFTLLAPAAEVIQKNQLPIALGAQDVSPFGNGPYTGEISASMIKEFASYVLVGHSERRQYFDESAEELASQSLQAQSAGLTVIYCTSDASEILPKSIDIIAYEPLDAIGTGIPEDPEVITSVCSTFRKQLGKPVIYGGSVTDQTLTNIVNTHAIDGLLVGGASLDPERFSTIGKIYHTMTL